MKTNLDVFRRQFSLTLKSGLLKLINKIQFRCLPILDTLAVANEDQKKGVEIVRYALKQPCFTIASNAGLDASVIVNKVELFFCMGLEVVLSVKCLIPLSKKILHRNCTDILVLEESFYNKYLSHRIINSL